MPQLPVNEAATLFAEVVSITPFDRKNFKGHTMRVKHLNSRPNDKHFETMTEFELSTYFDKAIERIRSGDRVKIEYLPMGREFDSQTKGLMFFNGFDVKSIKPMDQPKMASPQSNRSVKDDIPF